MNDLLFCGVNPQLFNGIRVFETPMASEPTTEPVKKHKWTGRKSSTGQRHWRIQKKWNKKYGFVRKACIFKTTRGYFVHPSLMAELRAVLAR